MRTRSSLTVPASFFRIREKFGDGVFCPAEAAPILGRGTKTYLELSRLVRLGWLFRVGRGRYATVDPLVRMTPGIERGIAPFRSRCWYPILQRTMGGILRAYGSRLLGVVLFGSAARDTAKPESDIDLFLLIDHRPDGDDLARETEILRNGAATLMVDEWDRSRHYHVPKALVSDPRVFETPGPVMIGVVADGRVLYDPSKALSIGLAELRRRFRKTGARQRTTADGTPYWEHGTLFARETTT